MKPLKSTKISKIPKARAAVAAFCRAKSFGRSDRVADLVHRSLAQFLGTRFRELSPEAPAMGMITVSAVKVSADLKNAKIFVSVLEGERAAKTVAFLNQVAPVCRHHLAKTLALRTVPTLSFALDSSSARGWQMESLLTRLIGAAPGA